jgi:DNA-directed RNA polymerase subunit RPC12/RpoP
MMIQCKECKAILQEPQIYWTIVCHGTLEKNEYGWEIDPLGEGNYVETLGIECDCGFRIEIVIDEDDIRQEHYRELIEKFTGLR